MLNTINELVGGYLPILTAVLILLVVILIYLQLKGRSKEKETKKSELQKNSKSYKETKEKEDGVFTPRIQEIIEPKIVDAKTFRIHSYIMNEIRSLTTDSQELGFNYKSDYIQLLIADIPKVIQYYLANFDEFKEGVIPAMPCIPENLIPPNQLIANTFMGGKCSLSLDRIKNTVAIPKKPYWLFEAEVKKVSLEKIFLAEEIGLSINELIRFAAYKDNLWRNTSNYMVGTSSLIDDVAPVIFRYNLKNDHPEISSFNAKEHARDYYLATCKDRVCFAE